ncbi:MAG: phosphoenolpyruvate phosphomutase family protein [Verrucomicrobiaceae bacterium]|nr:phosphoenolpyruvate phosphomutase family protein [Verrucomicrobiaceae bacterium]
MTSQLEKAEIFKRLHTEDGCFIMPNPWDAGSARLLQYLGFTALASTSAGFAFTRGRPDQSMQRDEVIAHLSELVAATDLPINADLENGFGDAPADVEKTIIAAAAIGVVGASIEDATGRSEQPIYSFELAVERIQAAAAAAKSQAVPVLLTARAENYLYGRTDLNDTIKRLQAYQEAGADVLYAPGIRTREDIAAIISSVDRPLNVLMGLSGVTVTKQELTELGVKRISVGGSLARAAISALLSAGKELRDEGTFNYANDAIGTADINGIFSVFVAAKKSE